MTLLPEHELQARRLIAQGLAGSNARPALKNPVYVIRHLLALQGQTYKAGIRAIALRIENGEASGQDIEATDALVHEAVANHEIVRAWPMRGTLHFLDAQDARWLMHLCSPRIEAAAAKRRHGLGFVEGDFERAREALYAHLLNLKTGEVLERRDAYRVFEDAGVSTADGRGPHLLRAFGGLGDVVQGSLAGYRETFQHIDRLRVNQRHLPAGQALAELGTRYVNGHGPVTVSDLAWWSGLTKRESTTALKSAENCVPMVIGDVEYFAPSWQLNITAEELEQALERTFYLPAFDEYLLGYSDKSFTMASEIRHEVLTMNGISWNFTVKNGTVIGRTA